MSATAKLPFQVAIGGRMRQAQERLAAAWLDRLRELLAVPAGLVFPSDHLLDHIPGLIGHLADEIEMPAGDGIGANTAVVAKAQELGELRFKQEASLHQILREYRLLTEVLTSFVAEATAGDGLEGTPSDVLACLSRLHDAVFVLLQTTADRFVECYSQMVTQQTARLEGFNRMVSHELRQPLGTVRSAVEILRSDPARIGAEARERCLELIEVNSRRMATITATLLTLSALDVNDLHMQDVDLSKVVADAAAQLENLAERKGVTVRLRVPPLQLRTDLARLELILINLLSNAIKYSDPAKTDRHVEITATDEAEGISISVRDNGVGIADADRARVFDGFYRAHASRDRELGADGFGLGLTIVSESARRLRATIAIDSGEGAGTVVHVLLPRVASEP